MKYISTSYAQFEKLISDKSNIYCFGGGKIFERVFQNLVNSHLENYVSACVDNKKNGILYICSREIEIISPNQLKSRLQIDDYLIITTKYYSSIIEQLEGMEEFKEAKCILYFVMDAMEHDYQRELLKDSYKLSTTETQKIPKVIHYCWFGEGEIPDECKHWMESWYKYCPDYEIIRWDEKNYNVEKNNFMREAYEAKKWAFVSDYARLDIIYNNGGIYLDTDVEIKQPIDDILRNEAFCGFEANDRVAFGLGYGASVKNEIIKEIMDVYEEKTFIMDNGEYDMTPCPYIQTDILKKHGLKQNGEYQIIDGMSVFPEIVLCGISQYTRLEIKDLSNTYMSHHYTASWDPQIRYYYESLKKFY